MELTGQVKTGKNDFSFWMKKLASYYTAKTGMVFFPGTLNIHDEFNLQDGDMVIVEVNDGEVIKIG